MIQGHNIFITGGAGFIGSYLCERLVAHNKLIVYDNEHRDALSLTSIREHPNLTFIKGDVLEQGRLVEAMQGCNLVLHMAAIAGLDNVVRKPITTMQVNLLGAYHVLEAVIRQKTPVQRLLLFSTSEVYGPRVYLADENGLTTQGSVGEPRWSYAISKIAADHMAFGYRDAYGLPVVIVRPFNVYGPRQVGEGAIHKFCVAAIEGQDLYVTGDGSQIRAWCFVDDFVDGVIAALEEDSAIGQVFNLGNPAQAMTILALAEMTIRLARSRSHIKFISHKMADVEIRVPSIQKAKDLLGFEPKVRLEEGIQRTLAWYGSH